MHDDSPRALQPRSPGQAPALFAIAQLVSSASARPIALHSQAPWVSRQRAPSQR